MKSCHKHLQTERKRNVFFKSDQDLLFDHLYHIFHKENLTVHTPEQRICVYEEESSKYTSLIVCLAISSVLSPQRMEE